MLFKKDLIEKVLSGQKTQTRRIHKHPLSVGHIYGIACSRYEKPRGYILITGRWQQRLGDITEEEIRKEGFTDLTEFAQKWADINGIWAPNLTVTAYEFRLVNKP